LYQVRVISRLINELTKLPGIGPKTAQRLTFHILGAPKDDAYKLAEAIIEARDKVKYCFICANISDSDMCSICADDARDNGILCVVEDVRAVVAMERTGQYKGLYHVLRGAISPMDGIGPEDIRIQELIARLKKGGIRELILATDPNVEGEATALYIAKLVKPMGILVTRIARGVPVGGDLEYIDEVTLARALEGRRDM
jgi:recombination protein RecR